MSSTSETVRACVEEDVFLLDALERRIVNARELARWLQEHKGVEGSIDTIASAIRRVASGLTTTSLDGAWRALKQANMELRDGVALVALDRSRAAPDQLATFLEHVDPGHLEFVRLVVDHATVTVVIDEGDLEPIRTALGEEGLGRCEDGLAEVSIQWPRRAAPAPGALGIALTALSIDGVDVEVVVGGGSGRSAMLIDRADRQQVVATIHRLTSQ